MIWASDGFIEQETNQFAQPVLTVIIGNYIVPRSDIADPGQISQSRPADFQGFISSTYDFSLHNIDGIYSPGKSSFIFTGQEWYRQPVAVGLSYDGVDETVFVFKGLISDWKVIEGEDGVLAEVTVTDYLSLCLERMIGLPDDLGTPNPVVYGTVFRNMESLEDRCFWNPNKSAYFETGNLSELSSVVEAGNGDVSINAVEHFAGNYSMKCTATTTNDQAYGKLSMSSYSNGCLFTARMKFPSIPQPATNLNAIIMGIHNNANNLIWSVRMRFDGLLAVNFSGNNFTTDCNLLNFEDEFFTMSLGFYAPASSLAKLWVNNDCVWSLYGNWASYGYPQHAWAGLWLVAANENWEVYVDNMEFYDAYYSLGYYLPGAPYDSVDRVWKDGALYARQKTFWPSWLPWLNQTRKSWETVYGPNARRFPYDNYDVYETYGMINALTETEPPSGTIFAQMTHDTKVHPVDMVTALLTEAGLDGLIDAANFAACKSATASDIFGAYFESISCGEAISSVISKALYNIVEKQGKLCLIPYTGRPLKTSVKNLNRSNCKSMEHYYDTANSITGVTVKWGWYEKDNSLFYRADNALLKAMMGDNPVALDMSYGSDVSSNDGATARSKADMLLKRLGGKTESIRTTGFLDCARVELGDGVTVINDHYFDGPQIFEIFEKTIDLAQFSVELIGMRFSGEA